MNRRSCEAGLDDRCRDFNGTIRRKRGDTLVGTLREEYGPSCAPDVRADMRLDTLLNRMGAESLNELIRSYRKRTS